MIKAIFFDLGNVIILNKSREVYENWANKLSMSVDDLRVIMRGFNDLRMSGKDITAAQFLVSENIQTITAPELEDLQKDIWGSEKVNKWLVDFINSNQGKYIFGVISNNFKEAEEVLLKKFNIPKFYSIFVSSTDVKVLKPNKEIYQYALSKTNLSPSECLFIDDSAESIKGAEDCGMQVIQYIDNKTLNISLDKILA